MNAKERARNRWKLLANTVSKKCQDQIFASQISYDLFNIECINTEWSKYSSCVQNNNFSAIVCRSPIIVTPEELMGFNNTGNVRIWPSEEVLAYYVLSNLDSFRDKTVLELGGGMSCLAGIMAALYGFCSDVHLTDGNPNSVYNVERILEKNVFTTKVTCSVLKWDQRPANICHYDVVLAADCLFFDEARDDLVHTIAASLSFGGVALVAAPKRGTTLYEFINMAQQEGLICTVQQNYNTLVWERHSKQVLYNPSYDADSHYPLLISITKTTKIIDCQFQTEFWKSTGKKFCDFCKCWIADNKPSIQFHENGKRHQSSVAKRLVDIKKNSAIERKEEQKMEMDMKRMEQNAMKAYYNDIQNNPDYSSQVLIKEKGLCIRPTPYIMTPQPAGPHVNISYSKNNMPVSIKPVPAPKPEYVWHQSRTDDGSDLMYYWNTETGESVWEPPAEGFLSVAEQEAEDSGKGVDGKGKDSKSKEKGATKKKAPTTGSKAKRKKTTDKKAGDDIDDVDEDGDDDDAGDTPQPPVRGEFEPFMAETTRIGSWKRVEKIQPQPVIDLQLPVQEFVAIKVPSTKEKEHTFKEKIVGSVSALTKNESTESISFKKSKFKKSNCRKRLDDD